MLTRVSDRAVSTHDALVHELDATAVFRAGARFAVVRGSCYGVAIETLRAKLAVATRRVVFADAEP